MKELGSPSRVITVTTPTINRRRSLEEEITPAGTIKGITVIREVMSSNSNYMTGVTKGPTLTRKSERL